MPVCSVSGHTVWRTWRSVPVTWRFARLCPPSVRRSAVIACCVFICFGWASPWGTMLSCS